MNHEPTKDPSDNSSTVEQKASESFPKLKPWSWIENGQILTSMVDRFYELRRDNKFDDAIAIAREFKVYTY
jgi:hypothetical protein